MRPGFLAIGILVLCSLATGCQRPSRHEEAARSPIEELGKLPGVRKTLLPALREELARIEEEGGTPELLTPRLPPPEENLAAVFHELFPADRLPFLLARSRELLLEGIPADDAAARALQEFLRPLEGQQKAVRAALHRPKCVFPIVYTAGFAADLAFADHVVMATRVELLEALLSASKGESGRSLESIGVALRISHRLSQTGHPHLRFEAARLRRAVLDVLQEIFSHGKVLREDAAALNEVVKNILATWPEDADTWKAARALGLHAYEVVRIGRLFDLLTDEEAKTLSQEYDLRSLVEKTRANADQDELYYLTQMRQVIELSRKPYFERKPALDRLVSEWQARKADEEVLVACRILLPMVEPGQLVQAEDQANTLAWAVALNAALGDQNATEVVNPLTGEKYWLESSGDWLYINGIGTDLGRHGAIEIPRFPSPK
ncbi:MAG: hypothetical protein KatS3mg112_1209 [Thermogutta sp.]|nr:MAG: hypothetical protein KatS3mg112_1209 [Thermogutta sp.]